MESFHLFLVWELLHSLVNSTIQTISLIKSTYLIRLRCRRKEYFHPSSSSLQFNSFWQKQLPKQGGLPYITKFFCSLSFPPTPSCPRQMEGLEKNIYTCPWYTASEKVQALADALFLCPSSALARVPTSSPGADDKIPSGV